MLSVYLGLKVITLSCFHCITKKVKQNESFFLQKLNKNTDLGFVIFRPRRMITGFLRVLIEGHLLGDEPEVEPGGRQLVLHAVAFLVDLKVV